VPTIRYVVPPELVPALEQVLNREIGDVRGMKVPYDLLDDIERISGSVNEVLVRKLVGDSQNGMMTKICFVSFSGKRNVHLRSPTAARRGTAPVCIEAFWRRCQRKSITQESDTTSSSHFGISLKH
jgi:hypothetical protein